MNILENIWCDETIKEGDKISVCQFDNSSQVSIIDFACQESNVNDIFVDTSNIYTFIRTEKCRGDRWVVLLTEDGEEQHINLSETYNCFYSVNDHSS